MAASLRLFGALLILLSVLVPDLAAALGLEGPPVAVEKPAPVDDGDYYGGACGEDEEQEELVDCGSELEARLDEPLAITLLRSTIVRTTKRQCEELLFDIWARQTCSAQGRDCGKLLPGAPPGPGPKLASSSSTGHSLIASLGVDAAPVRRLGPPFDVTMPKLRDLQPPVPPPKLPGH